MSKVLMIFIDAFSSKYLSADKTPFLYEISQRGFYKPLSPMFAFQGIGASIFSGTLPNTNKVWCDWVFKSNKNESHSVLLKSSLLISDFIPNDRLSKDFRYILYKLFNCDFGTPNLVPNELLSYFELKLKKSYQEKNSLGKITTLFEQLEKYNKKSFVYGLDNFCSDESAISKLIEAFSYDYDFYLIKLGSLDSIGHKYGPNSSQIYDRLHRIDFQVRDIFSKLTDNMHVVIFSDHGMSFVSKYVNLPGILKRTSLKMGKDYVLFLDSTVARFWFFNEKAKDTIFSEISQLDCGKILNQSDLNTFDIDTIGYEYGELFFALNEGYVFHPDFFRRHNPPKGMHGYSYPTDCPVLILYPQNKEITSIKEDNPLLIDIMPTVLNLLDVSIPDTCEGRSLVSIYDVNK